MNECFSYCSQASFFYHSFVAFAYISPLFGSVIADNYFGRFRVILWMSIIYVIGHVLLSVGAIPELDHSIRSIFDFGGLAVIAFATGGIKPCVSAFAADQVGYFALKIVRRKKSLKGSVNFNKVKSHRRIDKIYLSLVITML